MLQKLESFSGKTWFDRISFAAVCSQVTRSWEGVGEFFDLKLHHFGCDKKLFQPNSMQPVIQNCAISMQ